MSQAGKTELQKNLDDLNESAQKQLVMTKPNDHLIFEYTEGMIQFGMMTFFASAFVLAPFFAIISNLIEIHIKMNKMTKFSRRRVAQGASGIGYWVWVMEIWAIICVPINFAIIFFVGEVDETVQPDGTIEETYTAYFVKTMQARDAEYWTPLAVFLIVVVIEHALLAIKIFVASAIPDVSEQVMENERKRPIIEQWAEKDIKQFKKANNGQTYAEIMKDMENENDDEDETAEQKEERLARKDMSKLRILRRKADKEHHDMAKQAV